MTYDFVELNRNSSMPLYQQLYKNISTAIENGNLPQGTKLPSIRKFAEDLGLSRTTVEGAYQQLCVEGFIISKPQSGYYVNINISESKKQKNVQSIPKSLYRSENSIRYNLGSNSIDSETADIKLWRLHIKDILKKQDIIVSYGEPQGEIELRRAISFYSYTVRGVSCTEDNIVIGAGTQPLLYLLCGLLRNFGLNAAIEKGGFSKAEQVFNDCGFNVSHISCKSDGININELYNNDIKILFVNPSGNLITGQPMKISKRYDLIQWAEQSDGLIIEDDYNGELRFTSRPIPALQGMNSDRVVYIGSFSKLLLPSVRIGYMVLPPYLSKNYQSKSALYNQTASKIEQLALAKYICEGQLDRQLRRLRKIYAQKSELLNETLKSEFGSAAKITLHENSLSVTLVLEDNGTDIEAEALKHGLKVSKTETENKNEYALRLGFAGIRTDDIVSAVNIIKQIYNKKR